MPLVAVFLSWFLTRTTFGKTVKASAENRDLARLNGISPRRVSTFVWAVAGALATLSIALIAGQTGSATDLVNLGPSTLVRALAAAVIGGMVSFRRAFLAGIVIGVVEAVVAFNCLDQAGLIDFLIFLAILVAVYFQSRRGAEETQAFSFTPKRRPVPERLRSIWWVRNLDRGALLALAAAAIALPLIVTQPSRHLLYTTILVFALCGLSLTILTGLGRAALTRPDGVRRDRRARSPPRSSAASPSTSAGIRHARHPGRDREPGLRPVDRGRHARSPRRSRRSSASARSACAGCCSR